MADLRDGAAMKNIAEKPMTVARHGNQIAMLGLGDLQNFRGRIAHRQPDGNNQILLPQMRGGFFQVRPVVFDLLRFSELQLIEAARRPAIGDMQE